MSYSSALNSQSLRSQSIRAFGIFCALATAICAVIGLLTSRHWPLFGDAGIFHYIVFAMRHGARPYSQIKDFNFPGAYLLEDTAIRVFGGTATGERIYDLALCVFAALGCFLCIGKGFWGTVCATTASALIVLIHLQDGLAQAGQRDFAMSAFALIACGLYVRIRRQPELALFLYQFIGGFVFTIKPSLALLFFVPLLLSIDGKEPLGRRSRVFISVAGFSIWPAIMVVWLFAIRAWIPFQSLLRTIGVLHGGLARRTLPYLASHATSPLIALFVICLIGFVFKRSHWNRNISFLCAATTCGFISYWLQGKGLAYQRYPFLILAIALCFLIVKQQIEQHRVGEVFGLTILAIVACWFAPTMLHRILGFQSITPFESALAVSLERTQLVKDGSVQCMDTFDGCLTTLYDLKISQPTGYLYDCYLFTNEGPVRDSYRRGFLQSLKETRPRAIVMTDQHCFDQHDGFRRIKTWPELSDLLEKNYSLQDSWVSDKEYRLWSRPETRPAFRVYILRSLKAETN